MESLNKRLDSDPRARNLFIGGSLVVALFGCLLISFAVWSFVSGPAAAAEPTPQAQATRPSSFPTQAVATPTTASEAESTPTTAASAEPTSAGPAPTGDPDFPEPTLMSEGSPCDCAYPGVFRCRNFSSDAAAQACLDLCISQNLGDISRLDRDGDGLACND